MFDDFLDLCPLLARHRLESAAVALKACAKMEGGYMLAASMGR